MRCDLWNYQQKLDASRVRQAASAMRAFLATEGCAGLVYTTDGSAVIRLELWIWRWSLPGWGWLVRYGHARSCIRFAEDLLGWRPETEVTTCRR